MNSFSETIDQAKGLAILLVLLGHINSPFNALIFSFHVPFFFFLAGVFIKTSYPCAVYIRKGINRLLIPYLIFGGLGLIATYIKDVLLHRTLEPVTNSIDGWLFWMDSLHMQNYGFVLWFLPALLWGRTLTFFFFKHFQWNYIIQVSIGILAALLATRWVTLPFGFDRGLVAIPWIMMGYIFSQYRERWLSSGWPWIAMLVFFAALLISLGGMQRLDLAVKNIGNPLISLPYTLSIILLLIWLLHNNRMSSHFLGKNVENILIRFGQNSMLVLVFHVYTNNMMDIVVKHVLGTGFWLVTFIMSSAMVYLVIMLKYRYANSFVFRYL